MDKERELNALADVLLILTKELVENPTFAIKDAFKYVHREFVTEPLASEAAYYGFLKLTGKDIRKYDWYGGRVNTLDGGSLNINSLYTAEHMHTGKQFKDQLVNAYKSGNLTREYIKSLLKSRCVCWVTKEEDQRLKELGYNSERPDPEKAYREAGIVIYRPVAEPPASIPRVAGDCAFQPTAKGTISKIGECFTFTNKKLNFGNNHIGYEAYNEAGKLVGYVFETKDRRTTSYQKAELAFFNTYRGKKFCRFTSHGERVSWLFLSEKIEQEKNVTIYID